MGSVDIGAIINKVTAFLGKLFLFNMLSPFTEDYSLPFTIGFIILTSVILGFSLRFINFTEFFYSLKLILVGDKGNEVRGGQSNSPLRSLFAIVAGSTGLGGIAGISAVAVVAGPGPAFWVLVAPLLITPLRFAEVFLAHKYRERREDGSFSGGPSIYLRKALDAVHLPMLGKALAWSYGIFLLLASFGGPSSYQGNQIVRSLTLQFPSMRGKEVLIALVLVLIVGLVAFRNLAGVVSFLSTMAPITISLYFCSIIAVIVVNRSHVLSTIGLILGDAFDFKNSAPRIVKGMLLGLSRVAVATEVGLGTASVMHSNSSSKDSCREGILSMASPIISVLFVGFSTIFGVVLTGVYKTGEPGIALVSGAFATVSPLLGLVLVFMVPLMGLSVIIAWSTYGAAVTVSIFKSNLAGKVYLLMYILSVFAGCIVKDFDVVLRFCDVVNISLAVPNAIGILLSLSIITRAYLDYKKSA